MSVGGKAPGAGVELFAKYRSFLAVENGTSSTKSRDPSGGLWPFGVGWTASFAGGPLAGSTPSTAASLKFVDSDGVFWDAGPATTHVPNVVDPFGDPTTGPLSSGAMYAYGAIRGTRWVNMLGTWYREYPNRVLVEYAQTQTSSTNQVGFQPSRVFQFRPSLTPLTTAGELLWEVKFDYNASHEIQKISGSGIKDYQLLFTWNSFGGNRRIETIQLNHLTLGGSGWNWTDYTVTFSYDSAGQMTRVDYPKRSIRYKKEGDFSGTTSTNYLNEYDAKAYVFDYYGTTKRLKTVSREVGGNGQATLLEQETLNTYVGTTWKIDTQVEGGSRIHDFDYPASTVVEWVSPEGSTHKFTATGTVSSTLDPRKIFVQQYDLTPTDDPDLHGMKTWLLSYHSCTCGAIGSITLPSGRKVEYSYDAAGRLLREYSKIVPASTGAKRVWKREFYPWGLPWSNNRTEWEQASRLKHAWEEYAEGQSSGLKKWDYIWDVGMFMRITSPMNHVWKFHEDKYGRTTKAEAPVHDVDDGASTANATVEYSYDASGNLYQVMQHVDAGTRITTLTYDAMSRVKTSVDPDGTTEYEYDTASNITKIKLPSVTSGKTGSLNSVPMEVLIEYGVDDNVTQVRKTWLNDSGTSNGNATTEYQASYSIFGELIEDRVDSATQGNAGGIPWLTKKRVYDSMGRLTKVTHVHSGREIVHDLDSFNMIQSTKAKDGSGGWVTRSFSYDKEGNQTLLEDASGMKREYEYDTNYFWLKEVRALAQGSTTVQRKIALVYPSDGVRAHPANATYYVRSIGGGGALTSALRKEWTRDDMQRITTVKRVGLLGSGITKTSTAAWNGVVGVKLLTGENGRTSKRAYDKAGLVSWVEDALGNRKSFRRDINNRVDRVDRILKKTGASDVTYRDEIEYDEWGRVIKVTSNGNIGLGGSNAIRKTAYDSNSNRTYFEDAVDKKFAYEFDALGRLRKTKRTPKGGGTSIDSTIDIFDSASVATIGVNKDGYGTTYTDALVSHVVKRSDANGRTTTYIYNPLGQLVEKRAPGFSTANGGHSWTYKYDEESRLLEWMNGNNFVVSQVRTADPLKRVTRRWVHNPGTALTTISLFTSGEEWSYDKITSGKVEFEARTYSEDWLTASSLGNARRLINEKRQIDAFGLMHSEVFEFSHDGTSNGFKDSKTLTHAWSATGTPLDTGFRRGLTYGNGWTFTYTPDSAGKLASMQMATTPTGTPWTAGQWLYEGARAFSREVNLDSTVSTSFDTTWDVDKHRFLSGITEKFGATTVFGLTQEQNLEGFVEKKTYTNYLGNAGDRFLLDGYDRLQEAKLGVASGQLGNSWAAITTFDKHIKYALDSAQNRSGANGKDVITSGGTTSTEYTVDSSSNRYSTIGGVTIHYDGNGNLKFDGSKLFVYDYLDRLCEIWIWTPGTGESSQQTLTTKGTRLNMTPTQLSSSGSILRKQNASDRAKEKDGIAAVNKSLKGEYAKLRKSSGSGARQSSTSSIPEFTLLSIYGYDTGNRRILRHVEFDPEGTRWSTWDGWQQVEEYEDVGQPSFVAKKMFFRGPQLTETLGYATSTNGTTWTRYNLVQGTLGKIVKAFSPSGTVQEQYEYDPFGKRTAYDGSGVQITSLYGTNISQLESAGGGRHDWETGFLYLRNRYHWPEVGRFMSRDRLGAWTDSANWGNAYAYSGNSPIALHDPTGLTTYIPGSGGFGGGGLVGFGDGVSAATWNGEGEGGHLHPEKEVCFGAGNTVTVNGKTYTLSRPEGGFKKGDKYDAPVFWDDEPNGGVRFEVTGVDDQGNIASASGSYFSQTEIVVMGAVAAGLTMAMSVMDMHPGKRAVSGAARGIVNIIKNIFKKGGKEAGKTAVGCAARGGRSVLGHYPGYLEKASELGARRFSVPPEVWAKMTDAERWAANQKFLDRLILRGDEVILSTPAGRAIPGSSFARELEYLQSQGYRLVDNGTRLVLGR